MTDPTEQQKESAERVALRELVESIRSNTESVTLDDSRGTSGADVVIMTNPPIASAMREAEAVLGIKVSK